METGLEVDLRSKGLVEKAKKILESNLEEVDKLGYLSDKLLRLSCYEQKEGLSFTSISLKEALEEAVEKHTSLAKSKASEPPPIFDRFYRADTSRTKEKVTGFGLGLSIARAAVEKHHGKIEVVSTPRKRSTFTVILPTA